MNSFPNIRPLAIATAVTLCALSADVLAASSSGTFYCIGYAGSTQATGVDAADQYGHVTAQIFNPHGSRAVTIDEVRVLDASGRRLELVRGLPRVPKRGISVISTESTGFAAAQPGLVTMMIDWSQSRRNTTEPVGRVQNSLYDASGVYLGATINDCVSI